MKPTEFVVFNGDSSPNTPTYLIAEAMKKHIRIVGCDGEYKVLSYYYNEKDKSMTLEIERKK